MAAGGSHDELCQPAGSSGRAAVGALCSLALFSLKAAYEAGL